MLAPRETLEGSVCARVHRDFEDRIQRLAAAAGVPTSQAVRGALELGIAALEDEHGLG